MTLNTTHIHARRWMPSCKALWTRRSTCTNGTRSGSSEEEEEEEERLFAIENASCAYNLRRRRRRVSLFSIQDDDCDLPPVLFFRVSAPGACGTGGAERGERGRASKRVENLTVVWGGSRVMVA